MPLPDFNDLKNYLRIETDKEAPLLVDLMEEALAWAELLITRPIISRPRTIANIIPVFDELSGRSSLYVKPFPVASVPAPVLTDANGDIVDGADWALDSGIGRIISAENVTFSAFPYSVLATVGLDSHPDFEERYAPLLRTFIIGLASILYHERNPGASSESESGTSVSYSRKPGGELPDRLENIRQRLTPRRV